MRVFRARLNSAIVTWAVCCIVLIAVAPAQAVVIPLVNGSFELPAQPSGPYSYSSGPGSATGWSDPTPNNNLGGVQNIGPVGSSTEVEFPNPLGGAPDGNQALWLWAGDGSDPQWPTSTFVRQTTGIPVIAGTTYTLKGYFGQPLIGGTSLQVPQATSVMSLTQGGIAQSTFNGVGTSGFLSPFTFSWTAQSSGGLLGVELMTRNNYSYFDFVELESDGAVPEPASVAVWGALSAAFVAVSIWWRRKAG